MLSKPKSNAALRNDRHQPKATGATPPEASSTISAAEIDLSATRGVSVEIEKSIQAARKKRCGQECPHFSLRAGKLDEAFQFADAGGVAHFPQGFGLDLADPFAGDLELTSDFFEGAAVAVLEAETLF